MYLLTRFIISLFLQKQNLSVKENITFQHGTKISAYTSLSFVYLSNIYNVMCFIIWTFVYHREFTEFAIIFMLFTTRIFISSEKRRYFAINHNLVVFCKEISIMSFLALEAQIEKTEHLQTEINAVFWAFGTLPYTTLWSWFIHGVDDSFPVW